MKINLKDFLEFATYNRLFDYVYVPNIIGAEILLDDPQHTICFVECINHEVSCIYYPTDNWIKERKRRDEVQKDVSNMVK